MSGGGARTLLRGLPREVAGVISRHRVAAIAPAAALGAGADVVTVLSHDLGLEIAAGIVLAIVFEMYVGYAELLVAADRGEGPRPSIAMLMSRSWFLTPRLLLTSVPAVGLPLAASGLLVLPGLWLLTRWSLYAPAIVHEGLGAREGLARSAELVRGSFWAVACSGHRRPARRARRRPCHGPQRRAAPRHRSRAGGRSPGDRHRVAAGGVHDLARLRATRRAAAHPVRMMRCRRGSACL